jgi:hypothetical protein
LEIGAEVALVRHPFAAYRALARSHRPTGIVALARRPLLVCLVLGVSIALAATGRASAGLVLGTALCWSFVPAVQLAALALVRRRTRVARPLSSAADLFFMGHLPWSLWLLLVAGLAALTWPQGAAGWPAPLHAAIALSALLPAFGSAVLTFAFWREAAGLAHRRALKATAAYLALVWGFGLVYVALVAQYWPRAFAP